MIFTGGANMILPQLTLVQRGAMHTRAVSADIHKHSGTQSCFNTYDHKRKAKSPPIQRPAMLDEHEQASKISTDEAGMTDVSLCELQTTNSMT